MIFGAIVVLSISISGLDATKSEAKEFTRSYGIEAKWAYVPNQQIKSWNVVSKPVTDADSKRAERFWKLFKQEFSKYPKEFIKKTGLKEVDFVAGLSVVGQQRYAMPDFVNERLVLDVDNVDNDEWYVRHVIHHEFYHMIEEQLTGDAYFKDPSWAKLNTPGFKYGQGGASMRDGAVTPLRHPKKGFVNQYSTAGLEEDKAEIWAVMLCSSDWKIVSPWLKSDSVLSTKVAYLEQTASKLVPSMDRSYWKKVRAQ